MHVVLSLRGLRVGPSFYGVSCYSAYYCKKEQPQPKQLSFLHLLLQNQWRYLFTDRSLLVARVGLPNMGFVFALYSSPLSPVNDAVPETSSRTSVLPLVTS